MAPAIDRAQERIGAPPPAEPPFCALAGLDARRLCEDVICELDDARAQDVALWGRGAEVRRVFLADDGVVWECMREDGIDDSLCGKVGH